MMQPIPDTHSIGQGRDAVMEVFGVHRNLRRAALGLAAICLALLVPSALALAEPSAPRFTGAEQRREQTSPDARPLQLTQGDLDLWRSQDPPPVPPGAIRPSSSSGGTTNRWPGGMSLPIASAAGLAALLATIAGLREDRKVIPDPIPFASDPLGPVTIPGAPVSLDMPDGTPLSITVTPDVASKSHVSPYDKIPATRASGGGDGFPGADAAGDGNGTDSTGTGDNGVTADDSAPSATSPSMDSTDTGSDTESQSPILTALEGFGNRLWKFTDKVFGFSQIGAAYHKWRDGTGSGLDFAGALAMTGLKVLGAAALVAATVVCAPIVAGGGLLALGAAATTSAVVGASVGVLTAATIGGAWSLMDAAAANKSGEDMAADTLGGAFFGAGLGTIAHGLTADDQNKRPENPSHDVPVAEVAQAHEDGVVAADVALDENAAPANLGDIDAVQHGEDDSGGLASVDKVWDYSFNYDADKQNFNDGFTEHTGSLQEDLHLANFHDADAELGEDRSLKWWTSKEQAEQLQTSDDVNNTLALKSSWGARNEVTYATIPKGTSVTFTYGTARAQYDDATDRMLPGGGVQYRFQSFDESWITETRPFPGKEAVPDITTQPSDPPQAYKMPIRFLNPFKHQYPTQYPALNRPLSWLPIRLLMRIKRQSITRPPTWSQLLSRRPTKVPSLTLGPRTVTTRSARVPGICGLWGNDGGIMLMDDAAREFVRLCDIATRNAQEYLAQAVVQGRDRKAQRVRILLDTLQRLRNKAQDGTLPRPSGGAGLGLSKEVGEWNVDGSPLDASVRSLESFYMNHM